MQVPLALLNPMSSFRRGRHGIPPPSSTGDEVDIYI